MRTGHLLFSAVQFLFATLILLLGGFFISLSFAPNLRFAISHFFADFSHSFSPIGLSLLFCGILLIVGFYKMYQGTYYTLSMHGQIDPAVFNSYLKAYWQELFPGKEYFTQVILYPNQKLEIIVEIPSMEGKAHEQFLAKVEKEIAHILASQLGYYRDFQLTATLT